MSDRATEFMMQVLSEVAAARAKHPPMASAHEGRSVIREECDELWAHVMADTGHTPDALKEAKQVAAMGVRFALDVCGYDQPHCASIIGQAIAMQRQERGRGLSSAHEGHAYIMDWYAGLFGEVALLNSFGEVALLNSFGFSNDRAAHQALNLSAAAIEYALDVCPAHA